MLVPNAVRCISKPSSIEVVAIDRIPGHFRHPKISPLEGRPFGFGEFFLFEEHDENDSQIEGIRDDKIVHFADPLVTNTWDIPRPDADLLGDLYYSGSDIDRFREDRQERKRKIIEKKERSRTIYGQRDEAETFYSRMALDDYSNMDSHIKPNKTRNNHFVSCGPAAITSLYCKPRKWRKSAPNASAAALEALGEVDEYRYVGDTQAAVARLKELQRQGIFPNNKHQILRRRRGSC